MGRSPSAKQSSRRKYQSANRLRSGGTSLQLRYLWAYLVEEAAFCGMLAERGWPVLVYPGPLDPFRAVSDGEIPDAPESLRKLQIVSLKLKRQWLPGERPPRAPAAVVAPRPGGNGRLVAAK
ncbi:MAG: hypothetical protein JOZ63_14660 [Planctomycetaceae bacterium]|nr:hypothetical protein [Planctomycetaceae bacterium]